MIDKTKMLPLIAIKSPPYTYFVAAHRYEAAASQRDADWERMEEALGMLKAIINSKPICPKCGHTWSFIRVEAPRQELPGGMER